jgi:hypothetical protein
MIGEGKAEATRAGKACGKGTKLMDEMSSEVYCTGENRNYLLDAG